MVLFIKVYFLRIKNKEMEQKNIPMVSIFKVHFRIIKNKEVFTNSMKKKNLMESYIIIRNLVLVLWNTQMEINIMEIGSKTWDMEKEDLNTIMDKYMKVNFNSIKFKVLVKNFIHLINGLKDILLMGKSMERVN